MDRIIVEIFFILKTPYKKSVPRERHTEKVKSLIVVTQFHYSTGNMKKRETPFTKVCFPVENEI